VLADQEVLLSNPTESAPEMTLLFRTPM